MVTRRTAQTPRRAAPGVTRHNKTCTLAQRATGRSKASSYPTVRIVDHSRHSLLTFRAGSIIFACHKVNPPSASKNGSYSPHANQQSQQYYHDAGYNLPPLQVPSPYHQHGYPPQPSSAPYSAQSWSAGSDGAGYSQWSSQNTPMASSPSVSSIRSSTYGPAQHPQQPPPPPQHHWSTNPAGYTENNGYPFPPAGVHYPSVSPASTPVNPSTPAPEDIVPASSRSTSRRASKESFTGGGRGAGNPPVGVPKCSSCNVTHSPEWRKGPSGKKDLCNASVSATCRSNLRR